MIFAKTAGIEKQVLIHGTSRFTNIIITAEGKQQMTETLHT